MKKALILFAIVSMLCLTGAAGAQYNFTNPGGQLEADAELMFKAASTGDLATMRMLIGRNVDLANVRSTRDGRTPLHVAAMVGKLEAVKVLLDAGADPNVKDYYCKTPYAYAKMGYWHKVAKLLRFRGAQRERVRFFPHCCTEDHPNPAKRSGYCRCIPEGR